MYLSLRKNREQKKREKKTRNLHLTDIEVNRTAFDKHSLHNITPEHTRSSFFRLQGILGGALKADLRLGELDTFIDIFFFFFL